MKDHFCGKIKTFRVLFRRHWCAEGSMIHIFVWLSCLTNGMYCGRWGALNVPILPLSSYVNFSILVLKTMMYFCFSIICWCSDFFRRFCCSDVTSTHFCLCIFSVSTFVIINNIELKLCYAKSGNFNKPKIRFQQMCVSGYTI